MDAQTTSGAGPARQGKAPQNLLSASAADYQPLSAEQVYHDYAPRVFSTARRMLSNDIDAEDVTQDVLLAVVRKLPAFRGESAFPTWLHRVTVNAALSHRRQQALRRQHGLRTSLACRDDEDEPFSISGPRRTRPPDDLIADHELQESINRAIEALPPAYRSVFVLADVEGLANADVAQQLGVSLPAVKSRLHRARAMLRHALAPHVGEGKR
jgi:RNA polymerase sigma-70 factor (ECF subfamily)